MNNKHVAGNPAGFFSISLVPDEPLICCQILWILTEEQDISVTRVTAEDKPEYLSSHASLP
jgi:hypothetical protein